MYTKVMEEEIAFPNMRKVLKKAVKGLTHQTQAGLFTEELRYTLQAARLSRNRPNVVKTPATNVHYTSEEAEITENDKESKCGGRIGIYGERKSTVEVCDTTARLEDSRKPGTFVESLEVSQAANAQQVGRSL